ncbi:MAG: DUF1800 family protein [Bacteroidota bacterium]
MSYKTYFIHFYAILLLLLCWSPLAAQEYEDYLGAGHNRGITISSSPVADGFSAQAALDGIGIDSAYAKIQASRFLAQATLGADRELIDIVAEQGLEDWLDDQMAVPPSFMFGTMEYITAELERRCREAAPGDDLCNDLSEPQALFFPLAWWQNVLTAEDLVRQRVAFALSQIFVVSGAGLEDDPAGLVMSNYYDILVNNAFGNYEDLLLEITLNTFMGFYLSHLNNPRSQPERNIRPDENYAREVMQLFSIGLHELNEDGTTKRDNEGNLIPTYDNDDIREFAKIFTGLGNGSPDGSFGSGTQRIDFLVPMRMYENWHEPGPKFLLNGFTIPAGQSGMEDIEMAIGHLANHPNVGPFLARRLIQSLVKSNPSPAYIGRVARVFASDGSGERGNLGAMIKAILLDPEARDCAWLSHPENGKLREPVIRYAHLLRSLSARNDREEYWYNMNDFRNLLRQSPLFSPSVFNFFQPDYQPNGPIAERGLFGPEFQIHNSATSIAFINFSFLWSLGDFPMNNGALYELLELELPEDLRISFQNREAAGRENDAVMVDELDLILCHGLLSDTTRSTILEVLQDLEVAEPDLRFKAALYLLLISPDFAILR